MDITASSTVTSHQGCSLRADKAGDRLLNTSALMIEKYRYFLFHIIISLNFIANKRLIY